MKFLRKVLDKLKRKENVIILDTSALETKETMKIIEEASKVILLTGTIREMDKYKDAGGNLGNNIRIISRKSREDKKSQKYICVAGYESNNYQDDNIIEYCRKNKNAIILTNDNNLCNMAKAYEIPYIFPEDEEVLLEEKQKIKKKQNEPEIKDEGKKETKLQEKQYICQDVYFYHNSIRANAQKNHIKYVKVERDRKLIQIKDYQEGDVLYILDYNDKSKIIKVNVYNIEKVEGVYTAKKESENTIWYINEIFRSKFSEEMKDVIWKFYVKYREY